MEPTSCTIHIKRDNQKDIEVLVMGQIVPMFGQDRLIFSVTDIDGKPIELSLFEYDDAADALYAALR